MRETPAQPATSAAWKPLLTGLEADEAKAIAVEVSEAIEQRQAPGDGVSVAAGAAGFALLNAYLAVTVDDSGADERALVWIDRAIEGLQPGADASLFGGAAGVGWAAEHVSQLLGSEDVDPDGVLETALLDLLDSSPWQSDFDLISGLAGYGVYALERMPREGAHRCLERVVDRLEELAERSPGAATWFTPARLVPESQHEETPEGYYNLGVAHGVPGVVAVLAAATAAGVATERARALAEEGAEWLLSQRLGDDSASCFDFFVAPGREPVPARAAWCYGDPGVAAALLAAGRALGAPDLGREAAAIARAAAARDPEDCGVEDAWLCHGAAGLAHVFNRMHQATGDAALGEAARLWLRRALGLRSAREGFAGFHSAPERADYDGDGSGFLTGAAGVALTLLSASSDVEPGWDRLLAISARQAFS